LEAAKVLAKPPRILSSVRDVLRESASAARIAETVETFERYFDGVLVHADPALVSLDRSFAGWERIKPRAHYTGYVVETDSPPARAAKSGEVPSGEVIVSAGGGAVGGPLLRAAIAARPLTSLAGRTWRLLVGDNLPDVDRAALRAGNGVEIEPARTDFTTLLAGSALSISQAGYNTVVETLVHGDRAVLVPFATVRETEQARRAQLLAERGLVQTVSAYGLDGSVLAAAVERALAGRSIRSFPRCDANGGRATASLLASMA